MLVKELIEELKKVDPNKKVLVPKPLDKDRFEYQVVTLVDDCSKYPENDPKDCTDITIV